MDCRPLDYQHRDKNRSKARRAALDTQSAVVLLPPRPEPPAPPHIFNDKSEEDEMRYGLDCGSAWA